MIVCVCKAVSAHEIENAVKKGCVLEMLRKRAPGSICGACIPEVVEILRMYENDEHPENDD